MTRINVTITKHKSIDDMKQIADQIANHVTMINAITREEVRRETTPRAHDIIASVVLGTLMRIDDSFEWSIGQSVIQTSVDNASTQLIAAIMYNMEAFHLTGDSEYFVDAYETINAPLRQALRDWAAES